MKEYFSVKGNFFVPSIILLILGISIVFFVFEENGIAFRNLVTSTVSRDDRIEVFHEVESENDVLSETQEGEIITDIGEVSLEIDNEQATAEVTAYQSDTTGRKILPLLGLSALGEPVQREESNLRIGFVTDTQVASEPVGASQGRLGDIFVERINHIVRKMNDVLSPDFIVINGDVIEGTKTPAPQGTEELRQTKALFDQTSIPKYWVLGNHDVRSINKTQWKETLEIGYTSKAFRIKGYKIIILDSNFNAAGEDVVPGPGRSYTRGNVSQKEVDWLKKELESPEKKIVFLHHPPLRDIEKKPNILLLKNATVLRELFSNGNVIGVFSGHIEDLYSEQTDDVRYFVFPGMVKSSDYPGNFVSIDVEGDTIKAEMSYLGENGKYITIDIDTEKGVLE